MKARRFLCLALFVLLVSVHQGDRSRNQANETNQNQPSFSYNIATTAPTPLPADPNVVNVSDRTLVDSELSLLKQDNSGTSVVGDIRFPSDARILDVTKYGAKPNDGVDDTQAIQTAIAAALNSRNRYAAPPFVYFPKGTYNISDQLESRIGKGGWSDGWRAGMILFGESRKNTILKLNNNLPAFADRNNPRAVIKTGSEMNTQSNESGFGNQAFRHSIYNMTINVGSGNPGAVGIDYLANNRGAIENVILSSSDRQGFAGLLMKRYGPGPALVKKVRIEGFDYGIWSSQPEYSMTFEHLRLKDQNVAGIHNEENILNIRDLVSQNSVPAIEAVKDSGQIALLKSSFTGGTSNRAAIVNRGKLFARDIASTGYGKVIDDQNSGDRDVVGGSSKTAVQEYASEKINSLSASSSSWLNLYVKETPEFHTNDFTQWSNVVSFGATPDKDTDDDSDAIQAAIDSGKAIVYLPQGEYHVGKTITVRGNVRKIIGMQSGLIKKKGFSGDPTLRFVGGGGDATILEHLYIEGAIEHASSKSLAIRHADIHGYRNTASGKGDLFIEDVIGRPYQINGSQRVWARQLNAEFSAEPLIKNYGGTLWILGMKTEGEMTAIETVGGSTELLGALLYPLKDTTKAIPAFLNDRGRVSLIYTMTGKNYPVHVKERKSDNWSEFYREQVRGRGGMYVGS